MARDRLSSHVLPRYQAARRYEGALVFALDLLFGALHGRRGNQRERHLSGDPDLVRLADQAVLDASELGFPGCLERALPFDGS